MFDSCALAPGVVVGCRLAVRASAAARLPSLPVGNCPPTPSLPGLISRPAAGPNPGTFLLSSVANSHCHRRFLGADTGCRSSRLRLVERNSKHALLVWRFEP